jgi:hypothetical protein
VAICDSDPQRLRAVAERHPGLHATSEPDELLTADGIDIVSVASWNSAHFEQIAAALRAGKHVFADQPMVVAKQHARELRRLLERVGAGEPGTSCEPSAEQLTRLVALLLEPEGRALRARAARALRTGAP